MTDRTGADRARRNGLVVQTHGKRAPDRLDPLLGYAVDRSQADQLSVDHRDDTDFRLAELLCSCPDDFEYGLDVGRRARDDAQHLGGGGLLLQGFAQLVEQTRVFDGDDGLVGEALDQLYLLLGKGPNLLPVDGEGADQVIFLEHRDDEKRPEASQIDECDES